METLKFGFMILLVSAAESLSTCPNDFSVYRGPCIEHSKACESGLAFSNGTCLTVCHGDSTNRPSRPLPQCPKGTVLVKRSCLLIYCQNGFHVNGKCQQIVCPKGTYWNGFKCSAQLIGDHLVEVKGSVFQTEINTPNVFHKTKNVVVVNNVPNLETDMEKCCSVYTPRICQYSTMGSRWNCYSKRFRRCGDFCVSEKILLKESNVNLFEEDKMVTPQNLETSQCQQTIANMPWTSRLLRWC